MPRGRRHGREGKLAVVRQVEAGAGPAPVCREHGLANSVLTRWRQEDAERGAAACPPRTRRGGDAAAAHR